jgi:DNA-binding transcriptional MerR regulator
MPFKGLSTTKVARAAGCHPNTVRLYEQIGFIAPAPRSPKGYRLYTEAHCDQMRLARGLMAGGWPGRNIRRSMLAVIKKAAGGDYQEALDLAHHHRSVVRLELEYAETAVAYLESWAWGEPVKTGGERLQIGETSRLLGITVDALRNWERSGLLAVPRCAANRYRLYGPAEIGRLRVIRLLRQAGYSPMAVLRMLLQLDQGARTDLRAALDTPRPDEDVYTAADRWLTTLADHDQRADSAVTLLKEMVARYA